MLDRIARTAIDTLSTLGWTVRAAGEPHPLPAAINERYPAIPSSVRSFLEHVEECVNDRDQVWFLTSADYDGKSGSEFAWDAWEQREREDADEREAADITAFWNAHLPILLSVAGDYYYLAVCVDRSSADYGCIVQAYSPDFREPSTLCRSFDDLLKEIAELKEGDPDPDSDVAALFMAGDDSRLLKSKQAAARREQRLGDRLRERLYAWRLFESYRVGVVVERRFSRPLFAWENWSKIMRPLSVVISGVNAEAMIRPRQAGGDDNWLRFGSLPWNDKSNRTWTTKYLEDPDLAGKVTFMANEIWAPSRATSFERKRGPELFCLLDRNQADETQGFVLAIRKDMLSRADIVADETIYSVREFLGPHDVFTFDRRWGEFGRFGSTVNVNGLDWTGSTAVLQWAKTHKKHHVRSFRWRRWMG
jgi:hypothetical protein